MSIIKQNPFRVLGVTGDASEKEIQRQISTIKAYNKVGKTITFDFDFNILGELSRSEKEIQQASSKIEQADKKVLHSLFWFINKNQFDEIAFSNLKSSNYEKAIEIWVKTLRNEISSKNFSSYQNLSTLYIALATLNNSLNIELLRKGIELKGKLLFTENIKQFSQIVTGNGFFSDTEWLSKNFVDETINLIKPYLDQVEKLNIKQILQLFKSYPENIQNYILKLFTEIPLSIIENEINKSIEQRKNDPCNANKFVEIIYKNTKAEVVKLKSILGIDDIQFKMITNKLANEIMQCSIDYYNCHRDNSEDFDPGDVALKIAKLAKSLRPTGQTKDRIEENTAIIQEWVNNKEQRERYSKVQSEIDFIDEHLTDFQNKYITNANAKQLVISCRPKLTIIKNNLGAYDQFYLNLSGAVVGNALGMIIEVVNNAQEGIEYNQSKILLLPNIISEAFEVVKLIGQLDMPDKVKEYYNTNRATISKMNRELQSIANNRYSSSNNSSSGCYIATMAYGDYNHPQVIKLRNFRDDVLLKSIWGERFVRFYYASSPRLVKLLKNEKYINRIIRQILDNIIKWIKK